MKKQKLAVCYFCLFFEVTVTGMGVGSGEQGGRGPPEFSYMEQI